MAIDLTVLSIRQPLALRAMLPEFAAILSEILGYEPIERLVLCQIIDGRRMATEVDELRDGDTLKAPWYGIGFVDRPELVGVMGGGREVGIDMGARRTPLEYALGAAVAIGLARAWDSRILDNWLFFGDESSLSADELLEQLRA